MLLSCPKCKTIFRVDKKAIDNGRKVNCGVCKNIWFASSETLVEEKIKIPKEKHLAIPQGVVKDIEPIKKQKDLLVSKEINRSKEYKVKVKFFSRSRYISRSIIWFFIWIISLTFIIAFTGFYGKNYIASYFPETRKIFYSLNITLKPNLKFLYIIDFNAQNHNDHIKITGKIINKGYFTELSPIINISGFSIDGKLITTFDINGENISVKPGSPNFFKTELELSENERNAEIIEFKADLINKIPSIETR